MVEICKSRLSGPIVPRVGRKKKAVLSQIRAEWFRECCLIIAIQKVDLVHTLLSILRKKKGAGTM